MGTSGIILKLKKNKLFMEFFNLKSFFQLAKYVATGLISAGSYIFLIYLLTDCIKIWRYFSVNSYEISKYYSITVSYFIVFWLNFLLSKFWTFKDRQNNSTKKQLALYTALFVFNLLATYLIEYILTDIFGMYYLIPPIICNFLIVIWNFVLYKKVIYR